MPKPGDELTKAQVAQISNLSKYAADADDVTIDKNWHQGVNSGGLFEPWATEKDSGYGDGYPLYADVSIKGVKYHVYWMPLTNQMKLAGKGEDPRKT